MDTEQTETGADWRKFTLTTETPLAGFPLLLCADEQGRQSVCPAVVVGDAVTAGPAIIELEQGATWADLPFEEKAQVVAWITHAANLVGQCLAEYLADAHRAAWCDALQAIGVTDGDKLPVHVAGLVYEWQERNGSDAEPPLKELAELANQRTGGNRDGKAWTPKAIGQRRRRPDAKKIIGVLQDEEIDGR